MLEFKKVEDTRVWELYQDDDVVFKLNLMSSTITNKFHIITGFVAKLSNRFGSKFDTWFLNFLNDYESNEERRYEILSNNVPTIKDFVDTYLDESEIDFSSFVEKNKIKKNSIVMEEDEIKAIIHMSSYLKIYSIISQSVDLKLSKEQGKKIYNKFAEEMPSSVINKIYDVVKTKTYRYNMTDKFMWDYINLVICKTIDVHVVEIFNFIMNSIFVLCEEDKNPIVYFSTVVDESVKWFLRTVYKGDIVYSDTISTHDVHEINQDNVLTIAYNDALGRLKRNAYEYVQDQIEITAAQNVDEAIVSFHNRISKIEHISPLCEFIVYPLLSKATTIPFHYFSAIPAETACVLSAYLKSFLDKVFIGEYDTMKLYLDYYPDKPPVYATTYKIKHAKEFFNTFQTFFGFKGMIYPHDIISHFVGKMSRITMNHLYNDRVMVVTQHTKLEADMVRYFNLFTSGQLDEKIEKVCQLIDNEF